MSNPAEAIRDPYDPTDFQCWKAGEVTLVNNGDGTLSVIHKDPDERPNTWKGARRIAAITDESITADDPRPSGIVDYYIDGTRVSWGHGKEKRGYMCHRHITNKCPHIRRIDRYRGENFA